MQKMNGNEAAKLINQLILDENQQRKRKQPFSKIEDIQMTCNIVACTANTTEYWRNLAKDSGMVKMYNKPLTRHHVKEMLDNFYHSPREIIIE